MQRQLWIGGALASLLCGCAGPTMNAPTTSPSFHRQITTTGGVKVNLSLDAALNQDCSPASLQPTYKPSESPRHGKLEFTRIEHRPNYPAVNPRSQCNDRLVPTTAVTYTADRGYVGEDRLVYDVFLPDGVALTRTFDISVR